MLAFFLNGMQNEEFEELIVIKLRKEKNTVKK